MKFQCVKVIFYISLKLYLVVPQTLSIQLNYLLNLYLILNCFLELPVAVFLQEYDRK